MYLRSDQPPPEDGGAPAADGGLTDADFESNWDETTETFDAMGLPEELLRGIFSYGFEKPSAIQQRAIKPVMLGRDLIAQAQSGTVRDLQPLKLHELSLACPTFGDQPKEDGVSRVDATISAAKQSLEKNRGRTKLVKHHLSSLKRVNLDMSDNINSKSDLWEIGIASTIFQHCNKFSYVIVYFFVTG